MGRYISRDGDRAKIEIKTKRTQPTWTIGQLRISSRRIWPPSARNMRRTRLNAHCRRRRCQWNSWKRQRNSQLRRRDANWVPMSMSATTFSVGAKATGQTLSNVTQWIHISNKVNSHCLFSSFFPFCELLFAIQFSTFKIIVYTQTVHSMKKTIRQWPPSL